MFINAILGQLPNGSIAPNWTMTDINGVSHTLYNELNAGRAAIIDFSATWCGPCWNYHNGGAMKFVHNNYGPSGYNQMRVYYIEAEANNNQACLFGPAGCVGPNGGTQGNWVSGTPYPIIDNASQNGPYAIGFFPTIYCACPDKKIYVAGQLNGPALVAFAQSNCGLAAPITFTVSRTQPSCFGQTNGAINLTVNALAPPVTYAWSNGATTQNISNLAPGNYSCVLTDSRGTTVNVPNQTISAPAQLNLILGTTNSSSCGNNNGTAVVTPTGGTSPYTYLWSTGATIANPTNLPQGTHSVTTTDSRGCTRAITNVGIGGTQPPSINMAPAPGVLNCNNPSMTLSATANPGQSGNLSYAWGVANGGNVVSGGNTLTPNVNAPGTYTLSVTESGSNCVKSESLVVTGSLNQPNAVAGPANANISCTQASVSLNSTGSSTGPNMAYLWTLPNGSTATGPTLNATSPGAYVLRVTNTANGCFRTANLTVTSTGIPAVNLSSTNTITCTNPQTTLNVSSNVNNATVTWSGPGITPANANLVNPTVTQPGSYSVVLVNPSNNCSTTDNIVVQGNNTLPDATLTPSTSNLTCSLTSVSISSPTNAGNNYAWAGPGITNGQQTPSITVNQAGTYSLSVTNQGNGCVSSNSVVITASPEPVLSAASVSNVSCYNSSNGSATIQFSSGTGPFAYKWSNGATTATISNLPAGSYPYTLTDANTCEKTGTAQITEPAEVTGSLSVNHVTTNGGSDGSASVAIQGGVGNYTYLWSNGQTTASVSGLAPGNYTVVVKDGNDCSKSFSGTINPFNCSLSTSTTSTAPPCVGINTGVASVSGVNGAGNYTYLWSTGSTASTIQGLGAGIYSYTVSDGASCVAVGQIDFTNVPPAITLATSITHPSCPNSSDGGVYVVPSGGTPNYQFTWSPSGINSGSLPNGTYSFTVTDNLGCTASTSLVLLGEDKVKPTVKAKNASYELGSDGTRRITASDLNDGSTDNCSTNLLFEANPAVLNCSNIGDNVVWFTVTDEYGNSDSKSTTVTISDKSKPTIVCPNNITSNKCQEGVNFLPATADDNCSIKELKLVEGIPNGSIFPIGTTNQIFKATDPSGNEATCNFTVTVVNDLAAVGTVKEIIGTTPGGISLSVSGGNGPYGFTWTGPNAFTSDKKDVSVFDPGEYTVVVKDAFGCQKTYTYTVELRTSVSDKNNLPFQVYPNPVSELLFIDLGDLKVDMNNLQTRIYDLTGRIMSNVNPSLGSNNGFSLDVSNFPVGIYLLQLNDLSTGKRGVVKVEVMK
jgi:hypothetical protein